MTALQQKVSAVFVLGDSTADVGTNNFLPGFKARANFPPNGIDFPYSRPTGRESLSLEQGRLVLSVGCCPSQRVFNESGGCLEGLNDLALEFHSTIDALLMKLGSEYTDRKYSLGNTYEMSMNLIDNPFPFVELTVPISSDHSSGFKEVQTVCCGITRFNGEGICDKNANLCLNRHEYLFWDLFHPKMTASKLAALTLYAGEPRFVSPINFKQLAEA
ncbi:hypothetical protein OIU77_020815 [Salix suchowensis]|uniref:GDSL esterase/lipase n=1 Tax=Salix suchowensis TaxID=1278906 RepID=A0ABQ9CBH8_9ROSI|nr:hypothetical protein OIU77_020815 [Salix suchowensis]